MIADAMPKPPAEVIALDAERLQWPGQALAAGERFRLLYASKPALAARIGAQVQGAGQSWLLPAQPSNAPDAISEPLRKRFRYLPSGVLLALPEAAQRALPELLRGQLLVVREDSAGRVLALSRIQHAGALDALYAPRAASLPLGVEIAPGATAFALWAPTATQVTACLYDNGRSRSARLLA